MSTSRRRQRRCQNLVLRWADQVARRWLVRNKSPYLAEIAALAQRSREPGLYYLNVRYVGLYDSGEAGD